MDLYELLQGHIAAFLLMLTRISGIFLISPFFGSMNIPMFFRVGIALAMSVVLFPVVDGLGTPETPPSIIMFGAAVLGELFIGWLIGFVAYISFAAITMAGKVMDMQVGFAVVNVVDPTSGQQIPLIGSFLYNLAVIILLVTNGHHMLIAALVESFRAVPLAGLEANISLALIIANFTGTIFLTGMKIAMPITFAILLTNVGLGILSRTMPQMNIFVVGIPMQLMIGLFVLSMIMPFYVLFLDVLFNEMYGNISLAIRALQ
ncbi:MULTISPECIES: flagellar biosynthetic protein FliR [Selenomonas]|jgi:flagellar biosynthetic protein fliR|uniref:Flagellar biosynthetic protein FliR n=1 Tax=Selenomonas artemidis F0399 TaxID=749551 RepID=E7N0R8_9FIRM|nr:MULTISPECIES: flagellar biosynthetic protein FliR [Selenomonas]EFR41018.1 flagellar biosynthetic protein FliR [Selenomonas sp. oral taxon 137 str. F0430]EFW30276.1 flagellar biosynthetic protein FliR [Selenomonas artemidis F0399]EJP33187.1 flagellar biosynthetic protein FliR [Selenomonas sp. FOBRC9]